MTTPAGGILPGAIAAHGRPIKDGFDPAADAARRRGLGVPNGLQRLEDEAAVHGLHRKLAEDRCRVCRQGLLPLDPMACTFPCRVMRRDVGITALIECHDLRVLCRPGGPLSSIITASAEVGFTDMLHDSCAVQYSRPWLRSKNRNRNSRTVVTPVYVAASEGRRVRSGQRRPQMQ